MGSKHPGGFDASMADGSVRFFKDSVNNPPSLSGSSRVWPRAMEARPSRLPDARFLGLAPGYETASHRKFWPRLIFRRQLHCIVNNSAVVVSSEAFRNRLTLCKTPSIL